MGLDVSRSATSKAQQTAGRPIHYMSGEPWRASLDGGIKAIPTPVAFHSAVQRADHAHGAHARHVGVDHRRPYVLVPQKSLHRADVRARLKQVGGEAVPVMPISALAPLCRHLDYAASRSWTPVVVEPSPFARSIIRGSPGRPAVCRRAGTARAWSPLVWFGRGLFPSDAGLRGGRSGSSRRTRVRAKER